MRTPLLLPACLAALATVSGAQTLAVRGRAVHTMAGPPIPDGVVLVQDGKIAAVGAAAEVALPPGVRVLEAAVVTPGLVDAHSVVGLAGWLTAFCSAACRNTGSAGCSEATSAA